MFDLCFCLRRNAHSYRVGRWWSPYTGLPKILDPPTSHWGESIFYFPSAASGRCVTDRCERETRHLSIRGQIFSSTIRDLLHIFTAIRKLNIYQFEEKPFALSHFSNNQWKTFSFQMSLCNSFIDNFNYR